MELNLPDKYQMHIDMSSIQTKQVDNTTVYFVVLQCKEQSGHQYGQIVIQSPLGGNQATARSELQGTLNKIIDHVEAEKMGVGDSVHQIFSSKTAQQFPHLVSHLPGSSRTIDIFHQALNLESPKQATSSAVNRLFEYFSAKDELDEDEEDIAEELEETLPDLSGFERDSLLNDSTPLWDHVGSWDDVIAALPAIADIPAEQRSHVLTAIAPYTTETQSSKIFRMAAALPEEALNKLPQIINEDTDVSNKAAIFKHWFSDNDVKTSSLNYFKNIFSEIPSDKQMTLALLVSDNYQELGLQREERTLEQALDIRFASSPSPELAKVSFFYDVKLNLTPAMPIRSNTIKTELAEEWINKHSPECQEAVKALLGAVRHVSMDEFKVALTERVRDLDTLLANEPNQDYLSLVMEGKSNIWIQEQAMHLLENLPKNVFSVSKSYQGYLSEQIERMKNGESYYLPDKLVLFDDGIYSGEQMSGILRECMEVTSNLRNTCPDLPIPKIIVAPLYATQFGAEKVASASGHMASEALPEGFKDIIHILPYSKIQTIAEVIADKDHLSTLTQMYWPKDSFGAFVKGANSRGNLYFDFKVPDFLSFPVALEEGIVYNIDGSRQSDEVKFIPKTIPPYKPDFDKFRQEVENQEF